MNIRKYLVTFETSKTETVLASCEADARILAQAEQIKKGNQYVVESVVEQKRYGSHVDCPSCGSLR